MNVPKFCNVQASWEINGGADIAKIISYLVKKEYQSEESFCLQNEEDNIASVELYNENETNIPCELSVHCQPIHNLKISDISILSEAKTIEIYDETGAYMTSCRGSYVNDVEGKPMFYADYSWQQPASSAMLRCLSLPRKTAMKVVALEISLVKSKETSSTSLGTSFDFTKVKALLQDMQQDVPITDKAKACMQTIEQYQENQSRTLFDMRQGIGNTAMPQDQKNALSVMSGLMSTFANLSQLNTASKPPTCRTVNTSEAGVTPQLSDMCDMLDKLRGQVNGISEKEKQSAEETSTEDLCKNCGYRAHTEKVEKKLLQKMVEMEERIMKGVEFRLGRLEERINIKLDKILQTVGSSKKHDEADKDISKKKHFDSDQVSNEHLELD